MDITPLVAADTKIIDGYGVGFFRVNKEIMRGNLLISEGHAQLWQGEYSNEAFIPLLAQYISDLSFVPKIILLGTGNNTTNSEMRMLRQTWPFIEFMTTPAACRTYNSLITEGREVIAALFAVS